MQKYPFLFTLLLLLASVACAQTRPNILYVYVDDMGWGSIRPNGQDQRRIDGPPHVRTPNIDSLADTGLNFTRAYGATVCSPARSSQQLGFHQGHTYADRNDPDNAHTGTMRGLIQDGYPLVQSTGFPFVLGDSYTLSFQHRGFYNWDTGETAKVRVYYEEDGVSTDIFTASLPLTNGTWNEATYSIPAIADANADGKEVFISLAADNGTGFASFGEVSLIRHGPTTTVPGPEITTPGPDITVPGNRRMVLTGNYQAFNEATLNVTVAGASAPGEDHSQLQITGPATLAGRLSVTVDPAFTPAHGDTLSILTADSLSGSFSNPDNRITGSDGTVFDITYTSSSVTLTVDAATAQGTPYSWLESYEIDGGDPEAADLIDHDGDGMLAWQEYVAGTDPTDPTSLFAASIPATSGNLEIRWPSVAGRTYHVLQSPDLVTPFAPFAGPFSASPPENVFPIPEGPDRQFLKSRLRWSDPNSSSKPSARDGLLQEVLQFGCDFRMAGQ